MDLILMVGIPRSGKSTLAAAYQADGWTRICPDDIRWALTGHDHWPPADPTVWANAELMTRALLRGDHRVLIDATNTYRQTRRQWIQVARDFNITAKLVVLDTPLEECLRRNREATRRVPEDYLERKHQTFEMPTEKEGEVFVIKWRTEWALHIFCAAMRRIARMRSRSRRTIRGAATTTSGRYCLTIG
jgi:predicted kinase